MGQLKDKFTRREYIPGSGAKVIASSSRRSPKIQSEVGSLNFDLDEDEQPSVRRKHTTIASRST
jgi:hypothetical protein